MTMSSAPIEAFPPDPRRQSATLTSLACWLCGATAFAQCDVTAHQQYANAWFACTACDAKAGEICRPECDAANALIDLLAGIRAL